MGGRWRVESGALKGEGWKGAGWKMEGGKWKEEVEGLMDGRYMGGVEGGEDEKVDDGW